MAKEIADLVLSITRMCTIPKLLKLLQLHIIILNYINLVKQLSILALKVLGLPLSKLILPRTYLYLVTLPLLPITLTCFLGSPCLLNKYCLLRPSGTSRVRPQICNTFRGLNALPPLLTIPSGPSIRKELLFCQYTVYNFLNRCENTFSSFTGITSGSEHALATFNTRPELNLTSLVSL